ncbi:MAG: hypothetical protein AABZ80_13035 [Gemmatimonadota bacterium]
MKTGTETPPSQPPPLTKERMPLVIAPDVILDLISGTGDAARDAEALFEAIAADRAVQDPRDIRRPCFITPLTVPMIRYHAERHGGPHAAHEVVGCLLSLLLVAPLNNFDYYEALSFTKFEYEAAVLFVTYRRVGAKYLVTRDHFDVKRTPVPRRSPAEVLPLFR